MQLSTVIAEQRKVETRAASMKLRLWVHGNQGWQVQYYSQKFLSFGKKLNIARNYSRWAIERTSDGVILSGNRVI